MKRVACCLSIVFALLLFLTGPVGQSLAADPIILGVPTSLGFLEGKEGLACVNMVRIPTNPDSRSSPFRTPPNRSEATLGNL